jgi:hypothetical protein
MGDARSAECGEASTEGAKRLECGRSAPLSIGGLSILTSCFLAAAAFAQTALPGLVANGDFELADPVDQFRPAAWGKPDGLGVQWVDSGESAHRKVIRMDTRVSEKAMVEQWRKMGLTNEWNIPKPANSAVAETYGLSLYSDAMAVNPAQAYRITFDYKGPSGGAKVWVRGWGLFRGEKRRRWETYVACNTTGNGWATLSQAFFPTKSRPEVVEMRVMLYAFYPAGVYWFDNVWIEPLSVREYEAEKR